MSDNFSGKLIVLSAPSGAGKTTIVHHLLHQNMGLEFSISACSRSKRENEIDGKDYYFLSIEDFKEKIKNNEFVEWEEVYPDHFYGTLRTEVEKIWNSGHHVIFDVDVVGGLNIKQSYPKKTLAMFIQPPSIEELKKRLLNRSTDTLKNIEKRVSKAEKEISFAEQFDIIIVNDNLDDASEKAENEVRGFLES
ncbi:MAG: guanylate kinase [Bacteroidales bacterium]|nr:guanylate kinase [Bacteroidales bacterium]